MTQPFFGIQFVQIDNDALPPVLGDFSVVGLVLPSDDATASVFPLNTPVVFNSGDAASLAALGTGPLYKAVLRINAQLADFQVSARIVAVRVATGVDTAHTMANILGSPSAKTGIYALLLAPQLCSVTPRLLGSPGFTGATTYGVVSPVITAQGSGYTNPVATFDPPGATADVIASGAGVRATGTAALVGGGVGLITIDNPGTLYPTAPTVVLSGGGGTGAAAHAVIAGGVVTDIVVDTAGTSYTSAPTVTLSAPPAGQITAVNLTSSGNYASGVTPTITISDSQGGTGTGAAATISTELLANPLAAAYPDVASRLLAHVLVGGPGSTVQDALAWRQTLNHQRLIPQDDWEIIATLDGLSTEYIDGVARSLGLAVRTIYQNGGYPFHAWANQPIVDALGVKRPDGFSLTDGATDGQVLLAAGIGIAARGDASDTAIDDSGYVAISVNNATSDTLYNLYNKTIGADFINLALLKSIRHRLGKKNVTRKGVDAVLNDMTAVNVAIQSLDDPGIVGFKIGFSAANNTVEGLRAGKFTVYNDTEIPAPIIQITVNRGLDRAAELVLLQQLAADGTSSNAS